MKLNVITKANVRHIHKSVEVASITPASEIILNQTTGHAADIIRGIHGMTHIRMFGTRQLLLAIIVLVVMTPIKIITQAGNHKCLVITN